MMLRMRSRGGMRLLALDLEGGEANLTDVSENSGRTESVDFS